jgi:general secretion pathway protein L
MSNAIDELLARLDLQGFYRWWIGELRGLLPARLSLSAAEQPMLICVVDGAEVVLRRRDVGEVTELGRRPLPPESGAEPAAPVPLTTEVSTGRVLLRLTRRQALVRRVVLPLATLEDLRHVLGFEMERQTPFSAEQVYFDYRVVHKHVERQQVEVDLYVVPRVAVDGLLLRLGRMGIRPTIIDVGEPEDTSAPSINLLPVERRAARASGGQRLNRWLMALLVLLLIAAVAVPLWEKRRTVVTLLPLAEKARQEAEQVAALRGELETAVTDAQFLAEKKHQSPVVIDILDELTKILPDDTWLQVLELRGDEVRLQGESAQATALVGLVEASPMLQGAAFQSPVTRNPVTGAERFNLAAKVVREQKP